MFDVRGDFDSQDLDSVIKDLRIFGITNAAIRPGNNCIWVSYGRVNCYYIFHNHKLINVQVD